jgi:hypothetical protein
MSRRVGTLEWRQNLLGRNPPMDLVSWGHIIHTEDLLVIVHLLGTAWRLSKNSSPFQRGGTNGVSSLVPGQSLGARKVLLKMSCICRRFLFRAVLMI